MERKRTRHLPTPFLKYILVTGVEIARMATGHRTGKEETPGSAKSMRHRSREYRSVLRKYFF